MLEKTASFAVNQLSYDPLFIVMTTGRGKTWIPLVCTSTYRAVFVAWPPSFQSPHARSILEGMVPECNLNKPGRVPAFPLWHKKKLKSEV